MSDQTVNRRSFLAGAAALSAAVPSFAKMSARSAARVLGANDRINVGVIGTGGRGSYVAREFAKAGKGDGNCQIVAGYDVYQKRVNAHKEHFTKEYGKCDGVERMPMQTNGTILPLR